MRSLPKCPRTTCAAPSDGTGRRSQAHRRGSFRRKHDGRRIGRFHCDRCGRSFSASTSSLTFGQHKPAINAMVTKLLSSLVSGRRTAKLLKVNRKTVARRLPSCAAVARKEHAAELKQLAGSLTHLEFDDVHTSEHTKLKPLAVPLLVDHKTRYIVAIGVASMPASGLIAEKSRKKYGPRPDERRAVWSQVLAQAHRVSNLHHLTIVTDSHPDYPEAIRSALPHAVHVSVKSRRARSGASQGELRAGFDRIFSLNHTAAMLRANVNRLIRRTWCTTKRADRLNDHLALYLRFHNTALLDTRPEALV